MKILGRLRSEIGEYCRHLVGERARINHAILRAPQLRDAFAPESENLAAIIYHRNCLWPQVREALTFFQRRYEPMRDQVKALLAKKPSPEDLIAAVEAGDVLPGAVRNRLCLLIAYLLEGIQQRKE